MQSSSVSDQSTTKKGTKLKIEIKKRETKEQRAVAFSKRRQTVFSKAADLCLLSGANIAVFITSPSESSDVVYSFSGYSPAYEIADCYLKNKPPPKIVNRQSKLGFWWEDPNLYHSCDDLSELNIIEDRLQRAKKYVMACLEKKEKSQFVSDQNPSSSVHECCGDQNPSTCSLDEDCGRLSTQIVSNFGPNPSSSVHECCGDQILDSFQGDQNPNASSQSSSQIVSFDQINGESSCFDSKPCSLIQGGSSSSDQTCCFNIGCETEEENNQINLLQETQTQAMINLDDESCFWNDLFKDDVFGLNSDTCLDNTNDMIDLGDFKEDDMEWLDFNQFTY